MFLMPGLLIAVYCAERTLGVRFTEAQLAEMLRYTLTQQNADGGFGLHELGPSTLFASVMNYVAMRLLGEPADSNAAKAWYVFFVVSSRFHLRLSPL